jgi:hypothetical protein
MPCVCGAPVSLVQDRTGQDRTGQDGTGQDGTADSIAWDRQTDRQTDRQRTADRQTAEQGQDGRTAGVGVGGGTRAVHQA